jgi:hypothetical protein
MTPETQYTYSQTWVVVAEEALPYIALDPCVQRGDCRQLFPGLGVETKLPLAGVLDNASGNIYVPWYPGPGVPDENYDQPYGVRWSNELTQSGDWVFVCDPETVFITDPLNQPIYLLSTDGYTEDGRLVVTVFDAETNEVIREVFYVDSGKKLARYAIELWDNLAKPGRGAITSNIQLEAAWFSGVNTGEFAVVKGGYAFLYTDPLKPEGQQLYLDGGILIGVVPETFIQTAKGRFYFVGQSPQGRGWMLEDTFELASINSLWKLGCSQCVGNSGPSAPC